MLWLSCSPVFVGVFLFVTHLFGSNMANDLTEFFPNVSTNLTKVTWAHAVNSRKLLNQALSGDVMMLEADVVLGTLINHSDVEPIPIMGHPPSNVSDISLEQFLNEVKQFNEKQTEQGKKKGIKLDFKTITVFEMSVPIVQSLYEKMLYPVWINADIIPGPIKSTTTPVDPDRFFAGSKSFKRSTLSIGWTTRYGIYTEKGSYSDEHITQMIKSIEVNKVDRNITFPVRAGLAAESLVQMQRLIKDVPNSTLTIWSSIGDPVDVEKLRQLIFTIGLGTCYLDVPQDLAKKLHLDRPRTA